MRFNMKVGRQLNNNETFWKEEKWKALQDDKSF